MQQEYVTLERDCQARLVPVGDEITIPQGTPVLISQALGGAFTVHLGGNLARIDGQDGDALGRDIIKPEELEFEPDATIDDKVWAQIRTCFDPEIPINIADLGLIYGVEAIPLGMGEYQVNIEMTLTAPGCGMADVLVADVDFKVRAIAEVTDVNVNLVFEPLWDREMISEEARLELGIL